MWQLKDIHVSFDDRVILRGISADIGSCDLISLQGSNGAGKSTLFAVIAGSIIPDCGEIFLDGVNVTRVTESERSLLLARLMQDPKMACALDMTVAQNLALAALKGRRAGLSKVRYEADQGVGEMARALGFALDKLYALPISKLSGGQRQALVLMMALMRSPKLLLLDEPTAALDPEATHRLLMYIKQWVQNESAAAIMITHDVSEAEKICNRHWCLESGVLQDLEKPHHKILGDGHV